MTEKARDVWSQFPKVEEEEPPKIAFLDGLQRIVDASHYSFVNQGKEFFRYSTDAPANFGEIIMVQLLGHSMGYEPVHMIQPDEVHHNIYLVLVAPSTISRKSTTQRLAKKLYSRARWLKTEHSPEGLVQLMSERNEAIQWLPEFTSQLKGIKSGNYMARFVELYNDLYECPEVYDRGTARKKDEQTDWVINKPYLSLNSTTTPEMLLDNLSVEITVGGYLPRWIIVKGEPHPKPRERLREEIFNIRETLKEILEAVVSMEHKDCKFYMDDEALRLYNEIEKEAYSYEKILPFAGRYLNYVISIADILLISDAIGVAFAVGRNINTFNCLTDLARLIILTKLTKYDLPVEIGIVNGVPIEAVIKDATNNIDYNVKLVKDVKGDKSVKSLNLDLDHAVLVPAQYIRRAWQLIKPYLEYANDLIDYVELDKPTAKVMNIIKTRKRIQHCYCLQLSHLRVKLFRECIDTLIERHQIEIEKSSGTALNRLSNRFYVWKGEDAENAS
jgi:hypothetical protein